jgi:hypothetical protein
MKVEYSTFNSLVVDGGEWSPSHPGCLLLGKETLVTKGQETAWVIVPDVVVESKIHPCQKSNPD